MPVESLAFKATAVEGLTDLVRFRERGPEDDVDPKVIECCKNSLRLIRVRGIVEVGFWEKYRKTPSSPAA